LLYELPMFHHIDAESIEEALFWLRRYGEKARIIAGGTDLLRLMKDQVMGPKLSIPEVLVNVKTIQAMDQIVYNEKAGLRIGPAVTLNCLESSEIIGTDFDVLLMASRQVGTTQMRNMGTVVGNICQRPQCAYFRHPHFPCYKKGGSKCYAITGEHRYYHAILQRGKCVMAHPSDMAPVLIALNARVLISSPNQEKEIPMGDFYTGSDHLTETILQADELVKEIRVPRQKYKTYQIFLKQRIRHASDFALVSVAVVVQFAEQVCQNIRIVLGGIAPFPYLVPKAEEIMKGKRLSRRLIVQLLEASVEGAKPLPMNHYKIDLTKALVKKALEAILKEGKLFRHSIA